jgi:hypothetical protein
MMKTYVDAWVNWFLPPKVSFNAMPNALTDMTDTEPTVEHIEMYTSGFFLP